MDVVKVLVENNANISAKDNNGLTPFVIAVAQSHFEIATYLVANRT
jgi:ankyrin repeat protein